MNGRVRNKNVTVAQGCADKLPEDIIGRVFKCLPLHDAAKSCLVSRSWLCALKELSELRSAENLIGFSITLDEMVPNHQSATACELIAYLAHPCRIETISFGGHFCKFLTAGRIGSMFPTNYRFLKSLELSNIEAHNYGEFLWVVGMIKSCLVIEDLKISFSSKDCAEHTIAFYPQYQLCCLRKIYLTSVSGVIMELKLIEFLLHCSPALEIMSVKRDIRIEKFLESRLARKLMYFRRASSEAIVDYMDP